MRSDEVVIRVEKQQLNVYIGERGIIIKHQCKQ